MLCNNVFQNTLEVGDPWRDFIRYQNVQIHVKQVILSPTIFFHFPVEIIIDSHYCPHCLVPAYPYSYPGRQNTHRLTFRAGSETSLIVLVLLFFCKKQKPFLSSDFLLSKFISLVSGLFIACIIFVLPLSLPGITSVFLHLFILLIM